MVARAALLLLAALAPLAAQDTVRHRMIPDEPAPGQPFRLELSVTSPEDDPLGPAIRVGAELPLMDDIPMRFSGQRMGSFGGGGTSTLMVSAVAPATPGDHRIPAFALSFATRKVPVPAIAFRVREALPGENLGLARAQLELPDRPLYLGETVAGRIRFTHGEKERVAGVFGIEARGEGISFRSGISRMDGAEGGMVAEFELTPIRAGEVDLRLSGISLADPRSGRLAAEMRDRPFVFTRKVKVLRVPETGRPADWGGAVGNYAAESLKVSNASPMIGETIRMTATIVGEGNVDRILPPEVPHGDAWDVLPTRERRTFAAPGERAFTYNLTPRLPGALKTPPVRLSFFDPETRSYRRVEFAPVDVQVGGQAPRQVELVTADPAAPVTEIAAATPPSKLADPEPTAGGARETVAPLASGLGLAGANLTGLLALGAGLAVAARREWVARNPGRVARARARREVARALSRLRRAERAADAEAHARQAVEGLRAGAAPLLSGQAGALTAEDVLRAAGWADGARAEAVRAAFRCADGSRFGGRSPSGSLIHHAALAQGLAELRQRLCD
ncbi:MAG: hypothetical protein ACK5VI_08080 [Opitutia bacterium]|jgi:hypothetical protein